MVVRSWRARARPDKVDAYIAHAKGSVFPHLHGLSGFRGAILMRRDLESEVEILIYTFWASIDDIRAFAGDDIGIAVVEPAARAVLSQFDTAAQHYTVAHSCGFEFDKPSRSS